MPGLPGDLEQRRGKIQKGLPPSEEMLQLITWPLRKQEGPTPSTVGRLFGFVWFWKTLVHCHTGMGMAALL